MYNILLLSRSSAKDKKKKSKVATHESEGEDGNLAPSDGEDSNVSVIFLFIFHKLLIQSYLSSETKFKL